MTKVDFFFFFAMPCPELNAFVLQSLSYQHISEAPTLSRCNSELAHHGLQGSSLSLNRRGSEPSILPEASIGSWGGARRDSEPAFSSMAQLQTNFGNMSVSFNEEDEDVEKPVALWHPPNWALSKEFVPREATSGKLVAGIM